MSRCLFLPLVLFSFFSLPFLFGRWSVEAEGVSLFGSTRRSADSFALPYGPTGSLYSIEIQRFLGRRGKKRRHLFRGHQGQKRRAHDIKKSPNEKRIYLGFLFSFPGALSVLWFFFHSSSGLDDLFFSPWSREIALYEMCSFRFLRMAVFGDWQCRGVFLRQTPSFEASFFFLSATEQEAMHSMGERQCPIIRL